MVYKASTRGTQVQVGRQAVSGVDRQAGDRQAGSGSGSGAGSG